MSWNYRVMRECFTSEGADDEFGIHEVYYDDRGRVRHWTLGAVDVVSETPEGLRDVLDAMSIALDKPILDAETGKPVE